MQLHTKFKDSKPINGMLYLSRLPGSARSVMDTAEFITHVLRDA